MRKLLENIEGEDEELHPRYKGFMFISSLLLCEILRATCFALMYAVNIRTAIRASSATNMLLFSKLLTARCFANKPLGEIVNLFANDISKIFQMVNTLPLTVGTPVVALVTIIYTWWLLGFFYSFLSVIILGLLLFVEYSIGKIQTKYRKETMKLTDERISLTSELFMFIKLIKFYAWERPFADSVLGKDFYTFFHCTAEMEKIEEFICKDSIPVHLNLKLSNFIPECRRKECELLKKCQYLQSLNTSIALMTPLLATVTIILMYSTFSSDSLTSAKVSIERLYKIYIKAYKKFNHEIVRACLSLQHQT